MAPLAHLLNSIDVNRETSSSSGMLQDTTWSTPRLVDTGPLLRLDVCGEKLSKKERYGHPYHRPMYASGMHRDDFVALCVAYFRFGLRHCQVPEGKKVGGWSWEELNALNYGATIDWSTFSATDFVTGSGMHT